MNLKPHSMADIEEDINDYEMDDSDINRAK